MAFVSESSRDQGNMYITPTTGALGPGEYYNEGFIHK